MKRKAITPAEMKREYRRCLAREKDRYREWAKTRQGAFETRQILHFDAEAEEACEREHSTSWLSDRGEGAAAMYAKIEPEPLWRRLWRLAAARLPPKGRAVLAALMVDWRTAPAAKIAGVSRNCVDRWKTKLKTHFAQCWRAYERDFAK